MFKNTSLLPSGQEPAHCGSQLHIPVSLDTIGCNVRGAMSGIVDEDRARDRDTSDNPATLGGAQMMLRDQLSRERFGPCVLVTTMAPAAARSRGGYDGCGVSISERPRSISDSSSAYFAQGSLPQTLGRIPPGNCMSGKSRTDEVNVPLGGR